MFNSVGPLINDLYVWRQAQKVHALRYQDCKAKQLPQFRQSILVVNSCSSNFGGAWHIHAQIPHLVKRYNPLAQLIQNSYSMNAGIWLALFDKSWPPGSQGLQGCKDVQNHVEFDSPIITRGGHLEKSQLGNSMLEPWMHCHKSFA